MIKKTSRGLAVEILTLVEEEKAYANLLLQKRLEQLASSMDRHLCTLLVNGVSKNRLTLDFAMRRHLRKPISALPREVRGILRIGAFQLLYLDKIPPAAAVHESVELTKTKYNKFSGLVNGVLRQVLQTGWDFAWPDAQKEPIRYLSVRYSHPEWLVRRWYKRWGLTETEELCRANNEPATTWVRTNTLKISRAGLQEMLLAEGVQVTEGSRVPESLTIMGFGALERLESFQAGYFTVQDESSQLVAHVLGPLPGQAVLDVCSAPGGKTSHLAQLMKNQGQILAFDVHPHKLKLINDLAGRLGIGIIKTCLGDARELPEIKNFSQHKVLVDAPCSGLGVLRRKADLRWHKEEQDLAELPQLQLAILERAAAAVTVGGELLYSTCTIEPEENFEVVKAFRALHPEFIPVDIAEGLPFRLLDEKDRHQAQKGMLQLLPHRHRMDGFFLAKFRRVEV